MSENLTIKVYEPILNAMENLVRVDIPAEIKPQETADNQAKKLNIAEARENLTDLVNEVAYGGQRLVVMRRGKELAALVPMEDLQALRLIAVPQMSIRQDARSFSVTLPYGTETTQRVDNGAGTPSEKP